MQLPAAGTVRVTLGVSGSLPVTLGLPGRSQTLWLTPSHCGPLSVTVRRPQSRKSHKDLATDLSVPVQLQILVSPSSYRSWCPRPARDKDIRTHKDIRAHKDITTHEDIRTHKDKGQRETHKDT
eukprot:362177-Chlamydomonas_euryale.AAC.1